MWGEVERMGHETLNVVISGKKPDVIHATRC